MPPCPLRWRGILLEESLIGSPSSGQEKEASDWILWISDKITEEHLPQMLQHLPSQSELHYWGGCLLWWLQEPKWHLSLFHQREKEKGAMGQLGDEPEPKPQRGWDLPNICMRGSLPTPALLNFLAHLWGTCKKLPTAPFWGQCRLTNLYMLRLI